MNNTLEQIRTLLELYEEKKYTDVVSQSIALLEDLENKITFIRNLQNKAKTSLNQHKTFVTNGPDGTLILPEVKTETLVKPTNVSVTVNAVTDLESIPTMFHTYGRDIYCKLTKNVTIKVNMPHTISMHEAVKNKTIVCRNSRCTYQNCRFLHPGQSIVKVSTSSKSSNVEDLGKISSIKTDITKLDLLDIKMLLTYGISDLMLVVMWLQNKQNSDKIKNVIEMSVL